MNKALHCAWGRLTASAIAWATALLGGCAHVAVDADGTRHIVGFVKLTLPPAVHDIGADAMRVRSLGLTVSRGHAAGTQLTFGYSDLTLAAIKNDSAVSRVTLRRALQHTPTMEN